MDAMMLQSLYRLIDEPSDLEQLDGTVCCDNSVARSAHLPRPINVRRTIEKQLLFKTRRCRLTNCSRINCPYVHTGEKAYDRPSRRAIEAIVASEIRRLEQLSVGSGQLERT
jgi:hypothetical protein